VAVIVILLVFFIRWITFGGGLDRGVFIAVFDTFILSTWVLLMIVPVVFANQSLRHHHLYQLQIVKKKLATKLLDLPNCRISKGNRASKKNFEVEKHDSSFMTSIDDLAKDVLGLGRRVKLGQDQIEELIDGNSSRQATRLTLSVVLFVSCLCNFSYGVSCCVTETT